MSNASGKLVIIGILTVALASAGISWWFRYNATHRAAEFWGPQAARLTRDAPQVSFFYVVNSTGDLEDPGLREKIAKLNANGKVDISKAHGLAHLRNALLEDQSFDWASPTQAIPIAGWMLTFRDPTTNEEAAIVFSQDCQYCALLGASTGTPIVSCKPIATGLWEMFNEFEAVPPIVPPEHR